MKNIGSLKDLALYAVRNVCCVSGKRGDLQPGIVHIKRPNGSEMRKDGMVHQSVKAGQPYIKGGEITCVIRNNVKMELRRTKKGVIYADCRVA